MALVILLCLFYITCLKQTTCVSIKIDAQNAYAQSLEHHTFKQVHTSEGRGFESQGGLIILHNLLFPCNEGICLSKADRTSSKTSHQ